MLKCPNRAPARRRFLSAAFAAAFCFASTLFCGSAAGADGERPLWRAEKIIARSDASPADLGTALKICSQIISGGGKDVAEAWLLKAQAECFHGRGTQSALPFFEKATALAPPQSAVWIEGLFGQGFCLYRAEPRSRRTYLRAQSKFESLVVQVPDSPFAVRSLIFLGRIAEGEPEWKTPPYYTLARARYQKIIDEQPGSPLIHEAVLRLAATHIKEGFAPHPNSEAPLPTWKDRQTSVQNGISILESWLAEHPDNELASAMWEYAGNGYLHMWDDKAHHAKALQSYLCATGDGDMEKKGTPPLANKKNINRVNPSYLYWQIASLAEKLKKRKIALEYYCLMVTEAARYQKNLEALLRMTEQMGFSFEEIEPQLKRQWKNLGRSDEEIDLLIAQNREGLWHAQSATPP